MNLLSNPRLLIPIVLLLVSIPSLAAAQARERIFPAGVPEGRLMKDKAKELELSPETIAAIDDIVKGMRAKGAELRTEGLEAFGKMRDLLNESSPDEKTILKSVRAVGEIESQERVQRVQGTLALRALLSPEQLEKFIELRSKAQPRRQGQQRRPR